MNHRALRVLLVGFQLVLFGSGIGPPAAASAMTTTASAGSKGYDDQCLQELKEKVAGVYSVDARIAFYLFGDIANLADKPKHLNPTSLQYVALNDSDIEFKYNEFSPTICKKVSSSNGTKCDKITATVNGTAVITVRQYCNDNDPNNPTDCIYTPLCLKGNGSTSEEIKCDKGEDEYGFFSIPYANSGSWRVGVFAQRALLTTRTSTTTRSTSTAVRSTTTVGKSMMGSTVSTTQRTRASSSIPSSLPTTPITTTSITTSTSNWEEETSDTSTEESASLLALWIALPIAIIVSVAVLLLLVYFLWWKKRQKVVMQEATALSPEPAPLMTYHPVDEGIADTVINQLLKSGDTFRHTLSVRDLTRLCEVGAQHFLRQTSLLTLTAPMTVVGNLGGSIVDVVSVFDRHGYPNARPYLFSGGMLNGSLPQRLRLFFLLVSYAIKFPTTFFVTRSESEMAVTSGGRELVPAHKRGQLFNTEQLERHVASLGSSADTKKLYEAMVHMMNCMPIAAVIDGTTYCASGLPNVDALEEINEIQRPYDPSAYLTREPTRADRIYHAVVASKMAGLREKQAEDRFEDEDGRVKAFPGNDYTMKNGSEIVTTETVVKRAEKLNLGLVVRGGQFVDAGAVVLKVASNKPPILNIYSGLDSIRYNQSAVARIESGGNVHIMTQNAETATTDHDAVVAEARFEENKYDAWLELPKSVKMPEWYFKKAEVVVKGVVGEKQLPSLTDNLIVDVAPEPKSQSPYGHNLLIGDQILEVNGKPVRTLEQLLAELPSDDRKTTELTVSRAWNVEPASVQAVPIATRKLNCSYVEVTMSMKVPQFRDISSVGNENHARCTITYVHPAGPFGIALVAGDSLLAVDGRHFSNASDLFAYLDNLTRPKVSNELTLKLLVERSTVCNPSVPFAYRTFFRDNGGETAVSTNREGFRRQCHTEQVAAKSAVLDTTSALLARPSQIKPVCVPEHSKWEMTWTPRPTFKPRPPVDDATTRGYKPVTEKEDTETVTTTEMPTTNMASTQLASTQTASTQLASTQTASTQLDSTQTASNQLVPTQTSP